MYYIGLYVFFPVLFIIAKYLTIRKKYNLKNSIIFSISFTIFISIIIVLVSMDENDLDFKYQSIQFGVLIVAVLVSLLIDLVILKQQKNILKIKKKSKFKLLKSMKYYSIISVVLLVISLIVTALIIIVNYDIGINSWHIINFVITALILVWNIGFFIYKFKNKLKGEKLIIVGKNNTYDSYDVSTKLIYNLNNYIENNNYYLIEDKKGMIRGFGLNTWMRIIYLNNDLPINDKSITEVYIALTNIASKFIIIDLKKKIEI